MKITLNKDEPCPSRCPQCGGSLSLEEGGYTRVWFISQPDQPSVMRPVAVEEGLDIEGGDQFYRLVCRSNPIIHEFEIEAEDFNSNVDWG